jgi:hypothetical protein
VEKKALFTIAFISVLLFSAVGAFFVKSTQANPYRREFKFTEVPPPAGTQPPVIIIHTPQNGSIYPKNINLTFDVIIPETNDDKLISGGVSKLYYQASWEPNEVIISKYGFGESTSFSIDLSGVSGGNHSLTIYAVGCGSYEVSHKFINSFTIFYDIETFEITVNSTVSFIKDLVSPSISFLSPQNGTFVTSDVKLDFTVSEAASEILYCLDGKENQTITDSLTLPFLSAGVHNVTVYAQDVAGNVGSSETIYFSVEKPSTTLVATASVATIAVVGAGLLVYFKKPKRLFS